MSEAVLNRNGFPNDLCSTDDQIVTHIVTKLVVGLFQVVVVRHQHTELGASGAEVLVQNLDGLGIAYAIKEKTLCF